MWCAQRTCAQNVCSCCNEKSCTQGKVADYLTGSGAPDRMRPKMERVKCFIILIETPACLSVRWVGALHDTLPNLLAVEHPSHIGLESIRFGKRLVHRLGHRRDARVGPRLRLATRHRHHRIGHACLQRMVPSRADSRSRHALGTQRCPRHRSVAHRPNPCHAGRQARCKWCSQRRRCC